LISSVRESMLGFPGIFQPFFTWVTGAPHAKEVRIVKWNPIMVFIFAVMQISIGIYIGNLALSNEFVTMIALLFVAWPIIAGGMRRLDVLLIHQSLHKKVMKSDLGNRVIGEILTTLLFRAPYDANRTEHLIHHKYPCTELDIDIKYLESTGFKAGMSKKEYKAYILKALFSPKHHFKFLYSRIKGNFFSKAPIYRLVMAWGFLLTTLYVNQTYSLWLEWLILWFLPVSFWFQCITFIYSHTEHRWWIKQELVNGKVSKEVRDRLSFGRMCGDKTPQVPISKLGKYIYEWGRWYLRLCFLHVPYRLCVLVGDTVQHDVHHIHPNCDWSNSDYVRRDDLMNGSTRYSDVWGSVMDHLYASGSVIDYEASTKE
jgi:hypothetical protein